MEFLWDKKVSLEKQVIAKKAVTSIQAWCKLQI